MNYNCPNRDKSFDEWICLCPIKGKSAKDTLLTMNNGWIMSLIESARKKCNSPSFTEADALKEIAFLEEEASGTLAMWKTSL